MLGKSESKTNIFKISEDSSSENEDEDSGVKLKSGRQDNDHLDPADEADLEETAKYNRDSNWDFPVLTKRQKKPPPRPIATPSYEDMSHHKKLKSKRPPPPREVGFRGTLREAQQQGDTSYGSLCCPVIYETNSDDDDEQPKWEPIPYKILKELKTACATYGPTSPYTLTIVETLSGFWMTPYDWMQVAKACLSGGDFFLWKAEYDELPKYEARNNRRRNISVTAEMLMGEMISLAQKFKCTWEGKHYIRLLQWQYLPGENCLSLKAILQGFRMSGREQKRIMLISCIS